jgi:hypothetical protein
MSKSKGWYGKKRAFLAKRSAAFLGKPIVNRDFTPYILTMALWLPRY